ncbi:MAG: outer membrane beta-barrel protein [Hymenobacter sp.]
MAGKISATTTGRSRWARKVQWRPSDKWLLNSSTFFGNEQPRDSARQERFFHGLYATCSPNARWSVLALFDVGWQRRARPGTPATPWHTAALIVRRRLDARWTVAARAEYYYAQYGVVVRFLNPTPAQRDFFVRGGSLNPDYAPSRHVLVRLEGEIPELAQCPLSQRQRPACYQLR